jgi:hypothetical protein
LEKKAARHSMYMNQLLWSETQNESSTVLLAGITRFIRRDLDQEVIRRKKEEEADCNAACSRAALYIPR